jgi:hypothetical protein
MESFEHLCKVALESEGYVVTSNVKFPVRRLTKKQAREEFQEHGYEIDLVAARRTRLVLGEVKSFFGSQGVNRQSFEGLADTSRRTRFEGYKLLNQPDLRNAVVSRAAETYGYKPSQVEMRLYVGKFAGGHEADIRNHFAAFANPKVSIIGLNQIVDSILLAADRKMYTNDPVVMTVKALRFAGRLVEPGLSP